MLLSMTGFGAASGMVDGVEYSVEIRAVNNRYFRAAIKIPESWALAEIEIEALLRGRLSRGTVTLTMRMKMPEDASAYHVNNAALTSYLNQLRLVEVDANPTMRIDLGSLLLLPGVCEPPDMEGLRAKTFPGMMKLVQQALEKLMEMRRREGESLKADLSRQCEVIEKQLQTVALRAPVVISDYHQRLTARVKELTRTGNIKIDEDTLAREVAIFAERCDINEEISRLRGHVGQFRNAFSEPEPAGRKLEFLAQEMLREANTIASKANDAQIAIAAVEIKTAIDRIKEQSANAE
jgi:uncharacterized protein (TIGR00255 family)